MNIIEIIKRSVIFKFNRLEVETLDLIHEKWFHLRTYPSHVNDFVFWKRGWEKHYEKLPICVFQVKEMHMLMLEIYDRFSVNKIIKVTFIFLSYSA